ncbi:MAG: aldehyde dehydrogenase family protein, partial [Deltaproteobacteria bacterium]|nr:aldehyde dehydrogenase family protein [Deltaproteobacteria bacterium]
MPSDTAAVPLLLPFIGGRFVETAARRTLRAPYDGRVLAEVCECGPGELDAALRSAERALATTARLTTDKRAAICAATARGLEAQA